MEKCFVSGVVNVFRRSCVERLSTDLNRDAFNRVPRE